MWGLPVQLFSIKNKSLKASPRRFPGQSLYQKTEEYDDSTDDDATIGSEVWPHGIWYLLGDAFKEFFH